jgi:hypothetical protein
LRVVVVPGLCEGDESVIVHAIEPEIVAEAFFVPVGAFSHEGNGIPAGRHSYVAVINGIKEFVEGELGFLLRICVRGDEEHC